MEHQVVALGPTARLQDTVAAQVVALVVLVYY
jgi:hypothetical protein